MLISPPLEGGGEVVGEERAVRLRGWGLHVVITEFVPTPKFLNSPLAH